MSFQHNVDSSTVLSLVELEDAEEIFALVDTSRNYLRKWLPWVDFNTTSEDTKMFIYSARQQYADNKGFHCCIRHKTRVAGVIGFHRLDWTNKTTELAYWLGKQYQGQGLMTKCCKFLTDYAFNHLKLNRVEIRVSSANFKSCAIPERLGFIKEGTLRDVEWVNDRFVDNVVYSMLFKDWFLDT
jgi:ribosomal-protein-serine acetyltransferase